MTNFYSVPYYIAVGLIIGIIAACFLPRSWPFMNKASAAGAIALVIGWTVYLVRAVFGI